MSIPLPSITIASATVAAPFFCQLTGNTTINIAEAATVFVFVAGLIAWLSRKLQKIEDDVASLKDDLKRRPCQRDNDTADCPVRD